MNLPELGVFIHFLKTTQDNQPLMYANTTPRGQKYTEQKYDRSFEPKRTPDDCTLRDDNIELAATVPGTPTMLAFLSIYI